MSEKWESIDARNRNFQVYSSKRSSHLPLALEAADLEVVRDKSFGR